MAMESLKPDAEVVVVAFNAVCGQTTHKDEQQNVVIKEADKHFKHSSKKNQTVLTQWDFYVLIRTSWRMKI